MITYELAKELKDSGFLQPDQPTEKNIESWIISTIDGIAYYKGALYDLDQPYLYRFSPGICYTKYHVFIPTLSDLIEALNLEKFMLVKYQSKEIIWGDKECIWQAFDDNDSVCDNAASGKTPEEATALLWLEINKK